MRPPDNKKPAGEAGSLQSGKAGDTANATAPTLAAQWRIEVVNPVDGKPKVWDIYQDRSRAESVAATLRKHGFFVQVRRVDGDEIEVAP